MTLQSSPGRAGKFAQPSHMRKGSALFEQQLGALFLAVAGSVVQRSVVIVVRGLNVSLGFYKSFRTFQLAKATSELQQSWSQNNTQKAEMDIAWGPLCFCHSLMPVARPLAHV